MGETFKDFPFMKKEAAPNLKGAFNVVKNHIPAGVFTKALGKATNTDLNAPGGRFVLRPSDSHVDPNDLHMFNKDEVIDKSKHTKKREGTGSFATDGILGLVKKVVPKTKEPIEKTVHNVKSTLEGIDTAAGSLLSGKDPSKLRGKLFSQKVSRQVGEVKNDDGSVSKVMREDRRPSLVAPVENAIKISTPLLAATYIGNKLYPSSGKNVNQTTYESNQTKQAMETNEEAAFDKSLSDQMDKVASIQKIAQLEENILKISSELEEVVMEKTAIERRFEAVTKEKEEIEKQASLVKDELMEKSASFEELRLRTIAKARSKIAVELAEQMLDTGLVKQAHKDQMVDRLMECDEGELNIYHNMVKGASSHGECLESLMVLGEYKDNDKQATSLDNAKIGFSKRGQSIGEAARDLISH